MYGRFLYPTERNETTLLLEAMLEKLTLPDLARRLGYAPQTLQAWRRKERAPSLEALEVLRKFAPLVLSPGCIATIGQVKNRSPYVDNPKPKRGHTKRPV